MAGLVLRLLRNHHTCGQGWQNVRRKVGRSGQTLPLSYGVLESAPPDPHFKLQNLPLPARDVQDIAVAGVHPQAEALETSHHRPSSHAMSSTVAILSNLPSPGARPARPRDVLELPLLSRASIIFWHAAGLNSMRVIQGLLETAESKQALLRSSWAHAEFWECFRGSGPSVAVYIYCRL